MGRLSLEQTTVAKLYRSIATWMKKQWRGDDLKN
jgi:hypothetical protein